MTRLQRLAPLALAIALISLTGLATLGAHRNTADREATARDRAAQSAADLLDRRMLAYGEVLQGLAGLYESSRDITQAEFRDFTAGSRFQQRYPGFEALGFARLRGNGLIVERIEAANGNRSPLGFDLMSEPERRKAAQRALLSDQPAATAPITLITRPERNGGVLELVPTRIDDRPVGVVYAAFRMRNLLAGVLGARRDERVAVSDAGTLMAGREITGDDSRRRTLEIAGRAWTVHHQLLNHPLSTAERALPWAIAVLGGLLALLAGMLLHVLVGARSRAEARAGEMTAELQASKAELEHFAYLASHDLQEPLRTVTSFIGVLEQRLEGRLDDRERQYMTFVVEGARRMQALIAGLLEYSRTGHRADPAPLPLDEAWDMAVGSLAGAIEQTGAEITRDELPVVAADRREMVSVMQNLLSNAIKYRGEEAPRVHATAERVNDHWEVRVSDNGQGIDPRYHERVFQLFQRLHTAEEAEGTGVGLALVRKVARASGGDVHVESTVGAGSTFVIELPAS